MSRLVRRGKGDLETERQPRLGHKQPAERLTEPDEKDEDPNGSKFQAAEEQKEEEAETQSGKHLADAMSHLFHSSLPVAVLPRTGAPLIERLRNDQEICTTAGAKALTLSRLTSAAWAIHDPSLDSDPKIFVLPGQLFSC
jgi:hypothetical protein